MLDSIAKILKINTLIFILYFRLSIKYEEYLIQSNFFIFHIIMQQNNIFGNKM